jgi:hypothetical protein
MKNFKVISEYPLEHLKNALGCLSEIRDSATGGFE